MVVQPPPPLSVKFMVSRGSSVPRKEIKLAPAGLIPEYAAPWIHLLYLKYRASYIKVDYLQSLTLKYAHNTRKI